MKYSNSYFDKYGVEHFLEDDVDDTPLTPAEIAEAKGLDFTPALEAELSQKELDNLADYATELEEERAENHGHYDEDNDRDCRDY